MRDYGVDGQLGLEKTPEEYVAKMVEIFAEVWRVLKPEGTLWLNLGDSYNSTNGYARASKEYFRKGRVGGSADKKVIKHDTIKPKDLCGIPWMVAFALRSAGWYLRQDIIWHKPNPMPESVRDRCTKAHEYIFLMSKQAKYYCDMDSIREPVQESSLKRANYIGHSGTSKRLKEGVSWRPDDYECNPLGRNKRSVWTVTTRSYSEAHFATFPPDLIEPCILAGCPEDGLVLDPFMGSGTTALVAYENRRNYIGCELNPEYIKLNRADKAKEKYTLFETS